MITVSLVSHGHRELVANVLADLVNLPEVSSIVLTLNIREDVPFIPDVLQHKLILIKNDQPKGFASNHNAAFAHCKTAYFCVLNPDARLLENPFPGLLQGLTEPQVVMAAPIVLNSQRGLDDSIRRFPTPMRILRKLFGGNKGTYQFAKGDKPLYPHWVAGMFMMFESKAFADLNGFDESFFLYYEDVDICARIWKRGLKLIVCPDVAVIHDAQRDSHRKMKYLRWHLTSMLRFFMKYLGRLPDPDRNSGTL